MASRVMYDGRGTPLQSVTMVPAGIRDAAGESLHGLLLPACSR